MSKHEKYAISLASVALLLGLFMALHWRAGHWFARSGALVSVIAVVFASLQLRSRVEKAPAIAEKELLRIHESLRQNPAVAHLNHLQYDELVESVKQSVRQEVAAITRKVNHRIYLIELWLFIIGTLIWGYADIPLDWWLKN